MRELAEMRYQFEEPFIVDSSKIASHLGVRATPIDTALADTLTSYLQPSQGGCSIGLYSIVLLDEQGDAGGDEPP